jgi:hypothetical protein
MLCFNPMNHGLARFLVTAAVQNTPMLFRRHQMVETKEVQAETDLKKLDTQKVEALRGQLRKLLSNGQAHTVQASLQAPVESVPHSSHGDSDGWV